MEMAIYVVVGLFVFLSIAGAIRTRSFKKGDAVFEGMFGFDINGPNAEEELILQIRKTAQDITINPTEQNLTSIHALIQAVQHKGWLSKWK